MYPVSQVFLQAVRENTRKYRWRGMITTTEGDVYEFDEDFNGFETIGTAYDFMELCSLACRVELAQTRAMWGRVLGGFFCIT